LAPLNACHMLQSLDASCNSIYQTDDLSRLTSLKVNTIARWICHCHEKFSLSLSCFSI
jgi:hypothetical protein